VTDDAPVEQHPAVVLLVANETLSGDELITAVKARAEKGPIRVVVAAPVNEPGTGYVVYEHSRRAAAGRRLDWTLAELRLAGIPAHGGVVGMGPLDAVKDILAQEQVDELIVSTHPTAKSGWLRRNLIDEIRRVAGARPVTHVVGDVATRTGAVNVLVVANETVLGHELLARIRARAKEGHASFLLLAPQSDALETQHPDAERRLRAALSELRGEGVDAHGQIAHPDPFTAAMQAVHDERVDEIIVSTYPGERSGWLRRDLVGRLRAESGVPVEHIVVDPAHVEVTVP
jgi:hypothetical protein